MLQFQVTEVARVIDGDTIDVVIDLGFDLYKKERVRIAGVDTPEKELEILKKNSVLMPQLAQSNWTLHLW